MSNRYTYYKVWFTPLQSLEGNDYGDAIDVSQFIDASGVRSVKSSIDAGDYQIGVFTYGDINIKGINKDGIFNENDSRSIFPVGRDRCKVRIDYVLLDDEIGDETATITFKGIINEEATRTDPIRDQITFRVLSQDSVIRTTKVPAGRISSGSTVKTAIQNILNNPKITSVLNVSNANINPSNDISIDDGEVFNNQITRDALNDLLIVSNSVLIIDSSDNVIVKSRDVDFNDGFVEFFGPFDIFGRENIINLTNYNTGIHRTFTSVKINDQEVNDTGLGIDFGIRQFEKSYDFLTTTETEISVARGLLSEFKAPKLECEIEVKTDLAKDLDLLDLVSLNYPLRLKPASRFLPVVGQTKIGDSDERLPETYGSLKIDPNVAFKVIEKNENPSTFTTRLKLRQIGTTFSDGLFTEADVAIVGFAVVGVSIVANGATGPLWSAITGAARIGSTSI